MTLCAEGNLFHFEFHLAYSFRFQSIQLFVFDVFICILSSYPPEIPISEREEICLIGLKREFETPYSHFLVHVATAMHRS